jgi:very-short-patch-repair endonuclease
MVEEALRRVESPIEEAMYLALVGLSGNAEIYCSIYDGSPMTSLYEVRLADGLLDAEPYEDDRGHSVSKPRPLAWSVENLGRGDFRSDPDSGWWFESHEAVNRLGPRDAEAGDVLWLNLIPQVRCGPYRLDFVVFHDNEFGQLVAVECDGHDYHERTKEQAARDRRRDRALQAAGVSVLRFTGSEIWRDPEACALEVRNFVSDRRRAALAAHWARESA